MYDSIPRTRCTKGTQQESCYFKDYHSESHKPTLAVPAAEDNCKQDSCSTINITYLRAGQESWTPVPYNTMYEKINRNSQKIDLTLKDISHFL